MQHQYRTMKRNGAYQIEEKVGKNTWEVKHECPTVDAAKKILRIIKEQNKEES